MDEMELAKACAEQMFNDDQATRDLGMALEIIEPGVAEARMTVTASMVNGYSICHGVFFSRSPTAPSPMPAIAITT